MTRPCVSADAADATDAAGGKRCETASKGEAGSGPLSPGASFSQSRPAFPGPRRMLGVVVLLVPEPVPRLIEEWKGTLSEALAFL